MLGAGIGIGTDVYGLGIDSLKSVHLVTASGGVVEASKTSYPDLFWASRGAGAYFGIVTETTFTLQDQISDGNTVVASFTFTAASNLSIFEHFQSNDDTLPPELSLQLAISYNSTVDLTSIQLSLFYLGPVADAQPYLDAAYALGPLFNTSAILTQPALYNTLVGGQCGTGSPISGATVGLGRTDVPITQAVLADLAAFYGANVGVFVGQNIFQRYDNTLQLAKPAGDTSFPWRNIKTYRLHLNVILEASVEETSLELAKEIRAKLAATSGFSDEEVYMKYALGDEGAAAWWSAANLPRLEALKHFWDPGQVFGTANPVSTSAECK